MGSLLSKVTKCNRGNQDSLCKKKTISKGRKFFSKGKKLPCSQVAFEELNQEAKHPMVSLKSKAKRKGKEIWPRKKKMVSSYEQALRQQENDFMLRYLELQDRKRDRVSNWLDIMDTDKQSYSGLYLESDCSCNTSMYSIESSCDSKLNLGSKLNPRKESAIDSDLDSSCNTSMYSIESRCDSKLNLGSKINPRKESAIDSDPDCSCNTSMYSIESRCDSKLNLASYEYESRLDSSIDSDSDYMSDTLDYEADISSNNLDVDNLQTNDIIFNETAEFEDCFNPGGDYFGLYCDLFTSEVTRLYNEYYGPESESVLESQIKNLCAEKTAKLNLQENEAVFHNENGVAEL